jgi:hypothetical protein
MTEALGSRLAQRQAFMERLCEALGSLLGPRISVEAHGGKGVLVQLDQGTGGSTMARAAPWLPSLTLRKDLIRTADNVAHVVHSAVFEEWSHQAGIGPTSPSVAAVEDVVTIRFFGTTGDPLPAVEVPLG